MNYETLIAAHEKALKTGETGDLAELMHEHAIWETLTGSNDEKANKTKKETLDWFADQFWDTNLEYRCVFDSDFVTVLTHKTPNGDIVLLVTEFENEQIVKLTHARGPANRC